MVACYALIGQMVWTRMIGLLLGRLSATSVGCVMTYQLIERFSMYSRLSNTGAFRDLK